MFKMLSRMPWHRPLGRCLAASKANAAVDVDKCFDVMLRLVDEAAQHLKEANKKRPEYESKGNSQDLVTASDKHVEKLLIEGLKQHFPKHIYIGEEGTAGAAIGHKLSDGPTWIIDPIDGTTNFIHSFHYTCISVGFWLKGQPELACCYNPMLDQYFTARRGEGACLNGQRMQASGEKDISRALVMHELNSENFKPEYMDIQICNAKKMMLKTQAMRTSGSAAMDMCLVATGAADGYYEFYPHAWDLAAGVLLVREAGGVVIDPAGKEFDIMGRRVLAAATKELACQLVEVLGDMQIYHERDDQVKSKK